MKIVADENIPYVQEAFAELGEVATVSGRKIDAGTVRDAELLLVRSITKVDRALLDGSRVRFVATATIGEDHIDKAYLAGRGIVFASAPGSNANSVGEYVAAALLEIEARFGLPLKDSSLGIVGVGNAGKRVFAKAGALGMRCVLNDPPLARSSGDPKYRPLEEALDCDAITFHVPLTRDGGDATYHLVDETFLARLKPGVILINTSRGRVVDGAALERALDSGHVRACVLDVWEGEPNIDVSLLDRVAIGTPHIAGYSFDGKVNGTRMIYEAACRFLGCASAWDPAPLLPEPECAELRVVPGAGAVRDAVRAVYDIMQDDARMRRIADVSEEARGAYFDRLRKEYPRRRELFNTIAVVHPPDSALETCLRGLGFEGQRRH